MRKITQVLEEISKKAFIITCLSSVKGTRAYKCDIEFFLCLGWIVGANEALISPDKVIKTISNSEYLFDQLRNMIDVYFKSKGKKLNKQLLKLLANNENNFPMFRLDPKEYFHNNN